MFDAFTKNIGKWAMAFSVAAPSFVIPASVADNAYFLAQKAIEYPQIQEIGLCLFETQPCLDYTDKDLPKELAKLHFRFHVHLPMDLPWDAWGKNTLSSLHTEENLSGYNAGAAALKVMQKVAFLKPQAAILHPPNFASRETQFRLLQEFALVWYKELKIPLLLENIQGAPLYTLPKALFQHTTSGQGFGICLDIGHMFTFEQEAILSEKALLNAVGMVHWSAPGEELGKDKHASLQFFSSKQSELIMRMVPLLPKNCTHMIEVFQWQAFKNSLPLLQKILEP